MADRLEQRIAELASRANTAKADAQKAELAFRAVIRQAAKKGYSVRQLAQISGRSKTRIGEIITPPN